ncbi:leucyl aminopeptidase [Oceanirhabdus sp. W0125-5]|uniref:leucyl aminopeptidase n=1 Tax=Oceanirhabdus sp. W0125-5 TaxID=2999116 RepID=UPI0022F2C47A|nr:leucyl aminopeptidase [Oceanirhabdus sp. W0125-5]WBW96164.1 leucyl aminopeptidase [Oceanirhabdus sp. W0125-5]
MDIKVLQNIKEENIPKIIGVYCDTDSEIYTEKVNVLKEKKRFNGKFGEIYHVDNEEELFFIGLGEKEKITSEKGREISAKIVKELAKYKIEKANYYVFCKCNKIVRAMIDGLYLGNYKFDKYKTSDKEEFIIQEINLVIDKDLEEWISNEGISLAKSTIIARNLVNEPANVIYPESLANRVKELGEEHGFEVEVLGEKEIKELGMESYMSVARGSDNPPRFIIMRYMGDEDNKDDILGLVGKGLTYDSGGYSIKPTPGMVSMKSDMGGAAAVIGAMCSIAHMKLKRNVITVVAACENMISGNAYKPGDIINSMGGKTIEILNTDAEGRLTLIDAVYYIINKEKATKVVDIATLTGAVLVALGTTRTAVVSNNDDFYTSLEKASDKADEKVWRLPGDEDYKKLIKSDIADIKNLGGKYAGSITAGLFIGEFVGDTPWLHMDIAGTGWTDAPKKAYDHKGGTGVAVKTLYYLAKEEENVE